MCSLGFSWSYFLFMQQRHTIRVSDSIRYEENFTPEFSFSSDTNTVALYDFQEVTGTIVEVQ